MPKKEIKNRKSNKKAISKPSQSAIEIEKAYHIQKLREEMGWTWFELSYMLGKDNGSYVRDVENPLHTLKYDPADVNYIGLIWKKSFTNILPASVPAKNYNLHVVDYLDNVRRKIYEISLQNFTGKYIRYHTFMEERKGDILPTPLYTYELEEIKSFIDTLIADGFFDGPKTALDVLVKCREHFGENFHPRHMIRVLIEYCDGRKGKILDDNRKNDCGRKVYINPYNFDIITNSGVSKSLLEKGIDDFIGTAKFVEELPYRRNKDKKKSKGGIGGKLRNMQHQTCVAETPSR